MARNEIGGLRRSQALIPHGPGAIVDFRAGNAPVSVVAAGLEEWDRHSYKKGLNNAQVVYEPRLQRRLSVEGFRLPPVARQIRPGVVAQNADKLVGVRFPRWLQCPECHSLRPHTEWQRLDGDPGLYCAGCTERAGGRTKKAVMPVRFLVTCSAGHLDDFPWHFWVEHLGTCKQRQPSARSRLELRAGAAAGLAGLTVVCTECGAARSMEGCFSSKALSGLGPCSGKTPWLPAAPATCKYPRVVAQRGASNLYFAVYDSALDIPPWSDQIQRRLSRYWSKIRSVPAAKRRGLLDLLDLPAELGMSLDALLSEVEARIRILEDPTAVSLRWEEYCQLVRHDEPFGLGTVLELHPMPVPAELRSVLQKVVVVSRLREVRALRGFSRLTPPSGERDPRIAPISNGPLSWLPAIEVRGEGIFLDFHREALKSWEDRPELLARAADIQLSARAAGYRGARADIDSITPRLLLVHSFAHALMKQLSLDCGYSAASLRERIYVGAGNWDMAGVLIYTASPDSDGTLGGLARQGQPDALAGAIIGAIASMAWCSSDPLCIEGRNSLSHQLNKAACHACLLASETSCEEFNYMLDRASLVGTATDRSVGFFSEVLKDVEL